MKRVKEFLAKNWNQKSPLLLGYSGGPDSKALLYSLLEAGCSHLHVAHVDHGWRDESAREADEILREVEGLKLPFFIKRLNAEPKEAVAREARLKFFQSLFQKTPYQALVLGHQADDLAETILKRIFEGTHLPYIGGMTPISQFEEMTLWRPLLQIPKKKLITYLEARGLQPLFDPTNHDPAYLRSRMRMETIPFLNQNFGKNICENLCVLAERASELKEYLDQKVIHARVERDKTGCTIFCEKLKRMEQRHLLQKENVAFTRVVLEQVLDWVSERKVRKVFIDGKWIYSGKDKIVIENQQFTQN